MKTSGVFGCFSRDNYPDKIGFRPVHSMYVPAYKSVSNQMMFWVAYRVRNPVERSTVWFRDLIVWWEP